jgi:DNA repair exonuclease SbcCD nuclease subunit
MIDRIHCDLSGSIERVDFGEAGDRKCFVLVDVIRAKDILHI